MVSPGYEDATWEYEISFETAATNFDTSFITFDSSNLLQVSWETDYIDQQTTVRVIVKGIVTASWGDSFEGFAFFDLVLELPDCSETTEDITLSIGQAISEQFYFFGDGEKLIQVSDFSENSA